MLFDNEGVHNSIWAGNSFVLCAYVLCMVLLLIRRHDNERLCFLAFPSALICTIIYNPIVYSIIMKCLEAWEGRIAVYSRFADALLLIPILAGCVCVLMAENKTSRCFLVVIGIVLLLSYKTEKDAYRPFSTKVDYYHKMSAEALKICNVVLQNETQDISLLVLAEDDLQSSEYEQAAYSYYDIVGADNKYADLIDLEDYYTYYDLIYLTKEYTDRINVHNRTVGRYNNDTELDGLSEYKYIVCYSLTDVIAELESLEYESIYDKGMFCLLVKN